MMLTEKLWKPLLTVLIVGSVILIPRTAGSKWIRLIESIHRGGSPETITVKLNGKPEYRVFQVDRSEVVIALKQARLSDHLVKARNKKGRISRIRVDRHPGNVVVLSVYTQTPLRSVVAQWISSKKTLSVRFLPLNRGGQKQKTARTRTKKPAPKPAGAPQRAKEKKEISEPTYAGLPFGFTLSRIERWTPTNVDSTDQILEEMKSDECRSHSTISQAIDLAGKEAWKEIYRGLNRYITTPSKTPKTPKACMEAAYYLRAYAVYKQMGDADEDMQLKALERFQEVISYYPKSRYTPYAIAALGKTHLKLKNYGEARGYLKVIMDTYPAFSGRPEVMLELARVYIAKEKIGIATTMLERLLSNYPRSPFVSAAKLELGKAFYVANNFAESQKLFIGLMKSDPTKVFESPDLLVYLGNGYYQTGKYTKARDVLLRAVNFFPDLPNISVVLSRIGDTYRDDKQPEKAQKVHEHVIKNYPKSDGFVISSVRIAEYLNRRAEKENLYRMIMADYPDHPMAKLAMLKLAGLQSKEGEHEKSVETIKSFLARYPGALKKEAIHVMNGAYGGLFKQLMKAENSTGVLAWYEKDKHIINRINTPDIFMAVGEAYLKGHIYEDAATLLQKAYKLYDKGKRPPELYANLGVSLQASGQPDYALKILNTYVKTHPAHKEIGTGYAHIGQIHLEKKQYKKAIKALQTALKKSKDKTVRSMALLNEAAARKEVGELETAAKRFVKAIDLMAELPDPAPLRMSKAYRDLGETQLQQKAYLKAADAFTMSLKFSEEKGNHDLRFMLAESYEKGKAVERAGEVYQEIIGLGDPFWARLAQEKLRGIQIENKLKPEPSLNG